MPARQQVARTLAQLQGQLGALCAALPAEQQQTLQQLAGA